MHCRPAAPADVEAIARIYNQGIADRVATFETEARSPEQVGAWLDKRIPVVAVEDAGAVIAYAAAFPYRERPCYAGVREFSVYVAREHRGRGAGNLAIEGLKRAAAEDGAWKLVSRVFVENQPSRRMLARAGFREVGIYEKHGKLDGAWRDVVIVEHLIAGNL
ncbi:MAG: N-acetyltransferase [Proteobacteria bacterium]|nr:N-acetyltransferase [Pseudomonadota bacterium]